MTDLTFSRLSSQSLLSARDLQGSQQPLLTNYILTLMVSDISGFYCVLGDNSHRSQGYVHEQLALRRFLNMRAHKRFEHRPNPRACALTLGCDARESCPQLQKRAARLCSTTIQWENASYRYMCVAIHKIVNSRKLCKKSQLRRTAL